MSNTLKNFGVAFFAGGILAGIFVLIKSTEYTDTIIGISSIVSGILIGFTFGFFGEILENSDSQTILLRDIRDHFYPDEEEKEEAESNK